MRLLFLTYFWLLVPLIVWSVFWKGWALWRSARLGRKGWFAAFLLINTAGILEILYLFIFSKKDSETKAGN